MGSFSITIVIFLTLIIGTFSKIFTSIHTVITQSPFEGHISCSALTMLNNIVMDTFGAHS